MQSLVVPFDRAARPVDPGGLRALIRPLRDAAITDLLVFAHGACRDTNEARELATRLAASLGSALAHVPPSSPARAFALALIAWPTRAAHDPAHVDNPAPGDPGAGLRALAGEIDEFRIWLGPEAESETTELARLAPELPDRPEAREAFVQHAITLFARAVGGHRGTTLPLVPEEEPPALATLTPHEILERLRPPVPTNDPASPAPPGTHPGSFADGARRFLEFGASYALRVLADQIGEKGLAPLLQQLAGDLPALRLHLGGHGLGARLVLAAAHAAEDPAIQTLSLLQAAVSQFAFTADYRPGQDGSFRRIIAHRRIRGPILVTRSRHDAILVRATALASMLAAPTETAPAPFSSLYGSLGTHGARKLAPAEHANGLLGDPHFIAAHAELALLNLHADAQIRRHHDVTGPAVGNAILTAIHRTP
ncbi:MAG: hypothetical protein KF833_21220 [Verrucomicrobiae bacterium]|nr:hypothetical protein [Verrucomicrobiae bacterium]